MKVWKQLLVIIAAGCFVTLPLIVYGISVQSDDGATHVIWYTAFAEQFWSGDVYPRWLMSLNDGLGSPAFFYYPPVPYFLTSLLRPILPGDVNGIHQLGISASVSVILSGIFAWAWCRELTDDVPAVIGGVAFMVTPYHLVIDLYTRGAFAELWSFVWIPLMLFFVHRLVRGSRWAFAGLAVSYALLIGTHLPTTLIFSLVPVMYAWFVAENGRRLGAAIFVGVGMALGVGLAATYLYPAMMMQPYVFVDRMMLGHFSYSNWLLLSGFYYEQNVDLRPFYRLLFVFLDLIALMISAVLVVRHSEDIVVKRIAICWFAIGGTALLMMTDLSRPVWYLLPILQRVQFPFRFGVVASIAVTVLVVFAVRRMRETVWTGSALVVFFCLFLWLPVAAWGFSQYATPVKAQDVELKAKVIRARRDQAEYRPRWSQTMDAIDWNASTNEDDWSDKIADEYSSLVARTGAGDPHATKAAIASGTGTVEVNSWKPREILLHTSTTTASSIRVLQFYYPGWQARLVDSSVSLEVRPTEPDGLLSFDVPAGDHKVVVELAKTDAERLGQWISTASMFCLICYMAALGGLALRKKTGHIGSMGRTRE